MKLYFRSIVTIIGFLFPVFVFYMAGSPVLFENHSLTGAAVYVACFVTAALLSGRIGGLVAGFSMGILGVILNIRLTYIFSVS